MYLRQLDRCIFAQITGNHGIVSCFPGKPVMRIVPSPVSAVTGRFRRCFGVLLIAFVDDNSTCLYGKIKSEIFTGTPSPREGDQCMYLVHHFSPLRASLVCIECPVFLSPHRYCIYCSTKQDTKLTKEKQLPNHRNLRSIPRRTPLKKRTPFESFTIIELLAVCSLNSFQNAKNNPQTAHNYEWGLHFCVRIFFRAQTHLIEVENSVFPGFYNMEWQPTALPIFVNQSGEIFNESYSPFFERLP